MGRGGEMDGYEFLVSLVGFLFIFFFSGTGLTVWIEGHHSSPVSESDPPPFLMGERGVDRTPAYLGIFSSKHRNAVPSAVAYEWWVCDTHRFSAIYFANP